jgi:hypothetical protein
VSFVSLRNREIEVSHRAIVCTICCAVLALSNGFARAQQAPATSVQLPSFGIAIDAQGVLSVKEFNDPGGRLMRERQQAAQAQLPADVARPSPLRKISLRRLEAAVAKLLQAGRPPDDEMRYLAGLQRLQYVFYYPEEKELIVAGPAEGWMPDLSGRIVGLRSGRPVLELEDLVVALRAYPPSKRGVPALGCSIDPNPDSLQRVREFQRTVPSVVRQEQRNDVAMKVAAGMEEALGMAGIRVFGVPADTHFAHVLIEADYRMKLIGIGRERPPIRLASYLDLISSPQQGTLQRWWFTPNYECIRLADDRLAMELVGQGVQLQTEDKVILPTGQLADKAKANRASEEFTAGFTKQYPQLAAKTPIFAQLRNLIDMAVAAAFIKQEDFYGKSGWAMETLGDEAVFKVGGKPSPAKAPCVANSRWKGSRLLTPAGGGVDIQPAKALEAERVLRDEDSRVSKAREQAAKLPPDRWWWD